MTTYKTAYKTTTFVEGDTINVVHHLTKIIEHDVLKKTIRLNNGGGSRRPLKIGCILI